MTTLAAAFMAFLVGFVVGRAADGALFVCVAKTLSDARAARDAWLVKRKKEARREGSNGCP